MAVSIQQDIVTYVDGMSYTGQVVPSTNRPQSKVFYNQQESEKANRIMMATVARPVDASWFLSGQLRPGDPIQRISINTETFRVGRSPDATLCISRQTVSGQHAELVPGLGGLTIRDLGSTNGTYINGVRLSGEQEVHEGTLLQFADVVFRVVRRENEVNEQTMQGAASDQALALVQFDKLMSERAVVPHFQPIVRMESQEVLGYEVLARSRLFGLRDPKAMFSAAKFLDLESELSRMMRWEGMRVHRELTDAGSLFLNTHPSENVELDLLIFSLRELRDESGDAPIVLEIHEAVATCTQEMRRLRGVLDEIDMKLAYDDFGAGQARLIELVEVPPDYLKFDIHLIQGIEHDQGKRNVLRSLVQMSVDLGITALAEGIESRAEHDICLELGFELGQGYFYGKPAAAEKIAAEKIAARQPVI